MNLTRPQKYRRAVVDAELDQLRAEVITQKHRAELAEAKLDGAEKRAETAEMALRMITTGSGERTLSETPPVPSEIVVDLTDEPAEKPASEKASAGSWTLVEGSRTARLFDRLRKR